MDKRAIPCRHLFWFLVLLFAIPQVQAVEARLAWDRIVTLSVPVKGVITRLNVRPGERVPAGRLLVQLDQRPFQARVEALQARLREREAVLAEARRELARAEELYERTVLSEHELQLKKNDVITAEARHAQVRAELVRARLDLEYSTLRAPFDARILARLAGVGQTVVADMRPTPVIRLAAADSLRVEARLAPGEAARLRLGQRLPVRVGNERLEGEIVAITAPEGETGERYRVALRIVVGDRPWLAGQRAEFDLP